MRGRSALLEALGGEEACKTLSTQFYARVGKDPVLRPFFPGKSLRCATEEFAAFLIQFLGGDEKQTQHRWWLSFRESHARFQIGPNARTAWLKHMEATLDALLDSGAAVNARDRKGDTPRQRGINCRKNGVLQLLLEREPAGTAG